MKKIFFTFVGISIAVISLSLSISDNGKLELESAFANHTCCYEYKSLCSTSGSGAISNHVQKSGSCSGGGDGFFDTPFE